MSAPKKEKFWQLKIQNTLPVEVECTANPLEPHKLTINKIYVFEDGTAGTFCPLHSGIGDNDMVTVTIVHSKPPPKKESL